MLLNVAIIAKLLQFMYMKNKQFLVSNSTRRQKQTLIMSRMTSVFDLGGLNTVSCESLKVLSTFNRVFSAVIFLSRFSVDLPLEPAELDAEWSDSSDSDWSEWSSEWWLLFDLESLWESLFSALDLQSDSPAYYLKWRKMRIHLIIILTHWLAASQKSG